MFNFALLRKALASLPPKEGAVLRPLEEAGVSSHAFRSVDASGCATCCMNSKMGSRDIYGHVMQLNQCIRTRLGSSYGH